jgi:hypothetical protein
LGSDADATGQLERFSLRQVKLHPPKEKDTMPKIVVIGGGWAGCAAALAAHQAGAEVVLLERADTLLGTGQVGGIMRNNGRYTASEEMIALGAGELFRLTDENARHANVEFPGHKHASVYDVATMEARVRRYVQAQGIDVRMVCRVTKVSATDGAIADIQSENGETFEADAFVDATGTLGPQANCTKYGNGCAMCVSRCPTFGPRVSIAGKTGVTEYMATRAGGGFGAMSGSCKLHRESVDAGLIAALDRTGVCVVPIPKTLLAELKAKEEKLLAMKCCQQYALDAFAENLVLLDTGHVKLMAPFYPLADLRRIPGLENARYDDPYSGGIGNSIRFLAMSPRDNALRVDGVRNLFCGGEKAGPLVGHTEAICTGALAGHNAVRRALGKELIELPITLAVGDLIAFSNAQVRGGDLGSKYTFAGSVYFERMKSLGTYTTDQRIIRTRVREAGLANLFTRRIAE